MEFEYDEKIEEIQKDKDWSFGAAGNDEIKADQKYRKVDPEGKCDLEFNILTKFFQKVNDSKGKKKSEFVEKFFKEYLFPKDRKHAFAYLRLILPHLDRERGSYGLKEISLGRVIAESFGLPQNEAQRLKHYKNPSYHPQGVPVGDFVGVMHSVVKDLCKIKSDLTVEEVNHFLDELAEAEGKKEIEVMTRLMQRCSADDIFWIARIILKDLKIGIKHEKVLPLFHTDALDLYNVTSNLREVCRELQDPNKVMGSNIFRLFAPIKPMLAGKRKADEIRSVFAGSELLIETKFDGERIQCHFNADDLKFFSRNSNDYTHIYGPKLGQIVRDSLGAPAGILDGEIVVLEKKTWTTVQFGMNKTVALAEEEEEGEYQLCYMIFDILFVKGPKGEECNLMNVSLKDRRKVLRKVVTPVPHVVEIVEGVETTDVELIFSEFNNVMQKNEEGIIIKKLNSVYSPNDRGMDWVKLKSEYMEGMTDTLDLIVIGGYFGEGRVRIGAGDWTDHVTTFLLGVLKFVNEDTPRSSQIIPFTKVGTGYSVEELQDLRNKLRPQWKKFDPKNRPSYFTTWNPSTADNPDCYVDNPAESVVFEIKAAELIQTTTFASEYTLRFPRVVKIRYDKDWYEALTESEMLEMIKSVNENKGLRNLRRENGSEDEDNKDGDDDTAEGVERKTKQRKKLKTTAYSKNVYTQFQDTDTSRIEVISNLFQDCEFYVSNLDDSLVSKQFLEENIVRYGGRKVQNFKLTNTHVIGSFIDFKLKAILAKYDINIYRPQWVLDSIKKNELMDMAPKYMLYIVPYIQEKIAVYYDKFGDNYYKLSTTEDVKELLRAIPTQGTEILFDDEMRELRSELRAQLIQDSHPFRDKTFFQITQDCSADDKFLKAMITAKGGKVTSRLINETDYIIKSSFTSDQKKVIESFLRKNINCKLISKKELFGLL